jgi:hypothetical protein
VDVGKILIPFLKSEVYRRSSSTPAKVATKKPPPPKVPVDLCRIRLASRALLVNGEPLEEMELDLVPRRTRTVGSLELHGATAASRARRRFPRLESPCRPS